VDKDISVHRSLAILKYAFFFLHFETEANSSVPLKGSYGSNSDKSLYSVATDYLAL